MMGRPPCCDKVGVKKGPWTPEEDIILVSYIQEHGPGNWRSVPTNTGLLRCSKSCRLRWTNYLRPGIKRGNFTPHEEGMIIHLQALLGNKWAAIASYLPQRTDNDIKNYWNTHLKKKLKKFHHHDSTTTNTNNNNNNHKPSDHQSISTTTHNNTESTSDHHDNYNNTLKNSSSTYYASSTENISRLLEGWMRSSPATTTNNHHQPPPPPKITAAGHSYDHHHHQEFDHDQSVFLRPFDHHQNMIRSNNVSSWERSSPGDCTPRASMAAEDDEVKVEQRSDDDDQKYGSAAPPPPMSLLEKWLLDENNTAGSAATGHVEEIMELSAIF